jgi:crotonobetainyl-CoA:carnitine CoA-transferase CaiB-like acyl-CoA transferase
MLEQCPVLGWAASGGMALTGAPDGLPMVSPAGAFGLLGQALDQLAQMTGVRADPSELLGGRAALMGLRRQGRVSAGGSSRLFPAADGWCAVTLSRRDDVAAVPAILGSLGLHIPDISGLGGGSRAPREAEAWRALEAAARGAAAAALAEAAQLLGVPAAALPGDPGLPRESGLDGPGHDAAWPPWRRTKIAAPDPAARLAGAVVADLSSMWAGPLCARLLGLAGARVIKVESPSRPDGARAGDRDFFDWLHAGHQSIAIDFRTERDTLAALLRSADVVIEASRPRALANLGLSPDTIPHKKGRVWLSITGYGHAEPDRVAFGDDAAVAGGLVGWPDSALPGAGEGGTEPVFCADAIADPLTGVCGALAVSRSLAEGGGHLIDLSMRAVAATFATAPGPDHGPHEVRPDGTVTCPALRKAQEILPPRRPAAPGPAAPELGADTGSVLSWLASAAC